MGWSHCRVGISAWDMLLHGHTFVVPNCNPDQSVYDLCATCTHYCPAFGVFFLPCIYFLLRLHLLMAKVISVAINCNHTLIRIRYERDGYLSRLYCTCGCVWKKNGCTSGNSFNAVLLLLAQTFMWDLSVVESFCFADRCCCYGFEFDCGPLVLKRIVVIFCCCKYLSYDFIHTPA